MAQYVHNSWTSHTTGFTPFELLLGFTPQIRPLATTSSTLPNLEEKGRFLKELREQARQAIINAQQMVLRQCNKANGRKMFLGFNVGDKVWLDGTNLRLSHPSKKLAPKRYRPFTVTKVISPVVYRLALLPSWKIFDTFHASLLSPYKETPEHGTNFTEPPPDLIDGAKEYEVEAVLGQQTYGRGKKKQYLIKWKGYSDAHNSWEAATDVNAPELVREYLANRSTRIRTIQDKKLAEAHTQSMPRSISHRLSSAEYFYGYYPLDAIEATTQRGEDPEEICDAAARITHSDDTLASYYSARENNSHPRDEIPAAAYDASPQHFGAHLDAVEADLPRDVSLQGSGQLSLAPLPSAEELLGAMSSGEQRSPPRYASHTPCTLDTSDFVDHPLGDRGPNQLRTDTTSISTSTTEDVDRGEPGVAEDPGVDTSSTLSFDLYDYDPYDLSEGQALSSPADPTCD
jgi:hypothetical protein